jgi:hypothetical protein
MLSLPLVPPAVSPFRAFALVFPNIPLVFGQAYMERSGQGAAFGELNAFPEVAG